MAFTPARPRPRKTASKSRTSASRKMSRPRQWQRLHLDAADGQQPVDLLLRKAVHGLVGRQAVFVQPTELGLVVVERHGVAEHRQPVRAGQPGRAGADHRHALTAGRRAREQGLRRIGEIGVGGMALQRADFHRLVFLRVAHAGLFAQHLGRADTRAHAAEDVLFQDAVRRAAQVALSDARNEASGCRCRSGRPWCTARRSSNNSARLRAAPAPHSAAGARRRSCARSRPATAGHRRHPARRAEGLGSSWANPSRRCGQSPRRPFLPPEMMGPHCQAVSVPTLESPRSSPFLAAAMAARCMKLSPISALSPLDGRYAAKVAALRPLLSEFGLMHRRVQVEVEWFIALSDAGFAEFKPLTQGGARTAARPGAALLARPTRRPSRTSRRPPTTTSRRSSTGSSRRFEGQPELQRGRRVRALRLHQRGHQQHQPRADAARLRATEVLLPALDGLIAHAARDGARAGRRADAQPHPRPDRQPDHASARKSPTSSRGWRRRASASPASSCWPR